MKSYYFFLFLITQTTYIFGEEIAAAGECDPVHTLLNSNKSENCCSYEGVTCQNNHIISM